MDSPSASILQQLRSLHPDDFEAFVAEIWEHDGYNTTVKGGSGDRGIDVVAERDNLVSERLLIQAKRYAESNTVGSPEVQQYASLVHQQDAANAAVIVTTSSFTTQAAELAEQHGLNLIDGDRLVEIIDSNELESLVDEYASGDHADAAPGATERPNPEPATQAAGSQFSIELVALRSEAEIDRYTDGVYTEIHDNPNANRIAAFFNIENIGGHIKLKGHRSFTFKSTDGYDYKVSPESTGGLRFSMPGSWRSSIDLSHGQTQNVVMISTEIPTGVTIDRIEFDGGGDHFMFELTPETKATLREKTLDLDV